MKKLVCESLDQLFESPDWLSLNGKYDPDGYPSDAGKDVEGDNFELDYESEDAHPFWIDGEGKFQFGPAKSTHPYGVSRKDGMFPGRLWFYHKIMSFWEYPDKEEFFDMVKKMGDELKYYYPNDDYRIINDPEWQVEIIPGNSDIVTDDNGIMLSGPWRHQGQFQSKLIPIKDYQFGGTRSEEELGKEHAKSPMLKKKKVPQGWGSTHPKYQERRAWNMASLTSEGVADKYMTQHFGIADPDEEFDKQYFIQKYGKPITKVKNVPIYKNPKTLEGFDKGVRGVVMNNGDLYLAFSQEGPIHQTIINALKSVGVITGNTGGWEDVDAFNDYDFITLQRIWGKDKFGIGESYTLPKPKQDPEGRAKILKLFEPYLLKAKKVNSQFEWVLEQVRVVARGTLNATEYEEFKSKGSGA
jgi:hypothetical protein